MTERLRAPGGDGEILCVPPAEAWKDLAERGRAAAARGTIGGLPRPAWRKLARAEFAVAAGLPGLDPERLWIATGHQPELFHPGVWLKAFAVAAAARGMDGVGVQVRTDNDVAKALRIALPGPAGMVAQVPLDAGAAELPWEERRVHDLAFFLEFPQRAAEFAGPLDDTFVPALWEGFRAALLDHAEAPLGQLFADGRQAVERSWGVANAECALSALCGGEAFRLFARDVLTRPREFAALHNAELARYRLEQRLRSRNHPAADLADAGVWCETPFWGWTARAPRRLPVQAWAEGPRLRLRCGEHEATLDDGPLAALPFKLRPRALLTTAFLRLGVGDFFVHGLGGGKYDAVTNALLRSWWQLEPPPYAVATGTLRLPQAPPLEPLREALRQAQRRARSLRWNPDLHLPDHLADSDALAPTLERKAELLEADPPRGPQRQAWQRGFRAVAERLRPFVASELAAAAAAATLAADRLAAGQLLAAREFPWCVHPRGRLQAFLAKPDAAGHAPRGRA